MKFPKLDLVRGSSASEGRSLSGFFENPMNCAFGYQKAAYHWPVQTEAEEKLHLADMYFWAAGEQVAYIQQTCVDPSQSMATIEHFATEAGKTRRGIGRALAGAFFRELNVRYGISTLIFSERSTRYDEYYPQFFKSLGAQPVEIERQNRPNWHWSYSTIGPN